MKYLLDTNTCIELLKKKDANLVARIKMEGPGQICLCSVVVGELLFGVERSAPSHQAANLAKVEELRENFPSLSFDDEAAQEYAKIRAHLAALGTPIGPNDTQIAAIARTNRLILVTHNTGEFSRVPGLSLEDWQTP